MSKQKKHAPRYTTQDLSAQLKGRLEYLAGLVDERAISDEFQRYFDVMSRFASFSPNNQMLIWLHMPDATLVTKFTNWRALGRRIKKGAKGIPIWGKPRRFKKTEEVRNRRTGLVEEVEKEVQYWPIVYVFDVTQTEGDPLPDTPVWWHDGDEGQGIYDAALAYAQSLGIDVKEERYETKQRGVSKGGEIGLRVDLTPKARASVIIHELAHELLHQAEGAERVTREQAEVEAEATSWVVAQSFGIDMENAPSYIALHSHNSDTLKERLDRISKAARQIVEAIEKEAQK